jgi:hypothetical protein
MASAIVSYQCIGVLSAHETRFRGIIVHIDLELKVIGRKSFESNNNGALNVNFLFTLEYTLARRWQPKNELRAFIGINKSVKISQECCNDMRAFFYLKSHIFTGCSFDSSISLVNLTA